MTNPPDLMLQPEVMLRSESAGSRTTGSKASVTESAGIDSARSSPAGSGLTRGGALTLGLFSCKGGVGTTFLTAQLGYVLAQAGHRQVLLMDCVYPYGDLSVMLGDSTPTGSLSDLLRKPGRMDEHLLQSVLGKPYPGVNVLSGCSLTGLPREDLQRGLWHVFELARTRFDLIVLDCGRQPEPASLSLVHAADYLIPVLRPTLPMLRDARQLLIALRSQGISREQIFPVLTGHRWSSVALVQALEQALGCPLVHRIPEYSDLVRGSIMTGVPVPHLFPGHRLSQSIFRLGQALMGELPRGDRGRGSFWQRWWRSRPGYSDAALPKALPTAVPLQG